MCGWFWVTFVCLVCIGDLVCFVVLFIVCVCLGGLVGVLVVCGFV